MSSVVTFLLFFLSSFCAFSFCVFLIFSFYAFAFVLFLLLFLVIFGVLSFLCTFLLCSFCFVRGSLLCFPICFCVLLCSSVVFCSFELNFLLYFFFLCSALSLCSFHVLFFCVLFYCALFLCSFMFCFLSPFCVLLCCFVDAGGSWWPPCLPSHEVRQCKQKLMANTHVNTASLTGGGAYYLLFTFDKN